MQKVKRDDFPSMPDEDLLSIYNFRVMLHRRLSALPLFLTAVAAVMFWLTGYFQQNVFGSRFSDPIIPVINPVIFFLLGFYSAAVMFSADIVRHLKAATHISLIQLILLFCGIYYELFSGLAVAVMFFGIAINFVGHLIMIELIKDIDALRNCPSFPFDNHRRENKDQNTVKTELRGDYRDFIPAKERPVSSTDLNAAYVNARASWENILPESDYSEDFLQQHDLNYVPKRVEISKDELSD